MPTPPIPEKEARRRFRLVQEALDAGYPPPGQGYVGTTALSVALQRAGVPKGSSSSWLASAERVLGPFPWPEYSPKHNDPPQEQFNEELKRKEIDRRDETIRRLSKEIAALKREVISAEIVRDEILRVVTADISAPKWAEVPKVSAKAPGMPVLFLSDFHWGEVVDGRTLGGVNNYNLATARARLKRIIERTIRLLRDCQANPVYPGITILLGGDMVTGEINHELIVTNEQDPFPVLIDVTEHLSSAINLLAEVFGKVWIIGTHGNHGRNDPKPRFKRRAERNFDWLICQMLAKQFAKEKNIKISAPTTPDTDFSIYGLRYRLTHGDLLGVKGGDGIIGALGPIARGTKKTAEVAAVTGSSFDVLCMGHWHQTIRLDRVLVNGSLVGWNEYAAFGLRAVPEPPKQTLFFSHPDHGITQVWDVFADPSSAKRPFSAKEPVAI